MKTFIRPTAQEVIDEFELKIKHIDAIINGILEYALIYSISPDKASQLERNLREKSRLEKLIKEVI